MSPDDRNDENDGRESPAGKREANRPRPRTGKSGKTKEGSGAGDAGREADAPGRVASDDIGHVSDLGVPRPTARSGRRPNDHQRAHCE